MTFFKKDIKVIDQRFKENKAHYFLQCGMATVAVMMILLTIDTMFKEVMIASFGATAFSIFAMPHLRTSSGRSVVGGYAIGMVLGVVFNLVAIYLESASGWHSAYSVMGAVAVGLAFALYDHDKLRTSAGSRFGTGVGAPRLSHQLAFNHLCVCHHPFGYQASFAQLAD